MTTQEATTDNLAMAVRIATRKSNPHGSFDKGGRFYLAHQCPACAGIRYPSRRWPYSQLVHGRSVKHLAHEYQVDPRELRRAIKAAQQAAEEEARILAEAGF